MPVSSASEKELLEINVQIEHLIQTVLEQFYSLRKGIETADFERLKTVILKDREVDAIESKIDDLSTRFVQNRAPLGSSLRFMFGSIDIASALERIGDCIEYVARHVVENQELRTDFHDGWTLLVDMTGRTLSVFEKATTCLSTRNVTLARNLPQLDEMIDALQDQGYKLVIDHVRASKVDVELALHLVLIVNKLESIADIACHIAETVVYIVEDTNIRHRAVVGS